MTQNIQKRKTRKRNLGWQVTKSLYVVLVLAMLLTTASYSWFSLSRTPSVSDMGLFISNVEGLELSTNPNAPDDEWRETLDFSKLVYNAAPLRPATWSEANQSFYAAIYGYDGRVVDVSQKLTDEANSTQGGDDVYYMKLTFFARTGQQVKVGLTKASTKADGTQGFGTFLYGKPIWNPATLSHDNAGGGADEAIRIGFRITITHADGSQSEPKFIVYEPSCGVVDPKTGEGYMPTNSMDGTENIVPEDRLIRQTSSTWKEAYPVLRDTVSADLGEFLDPTTLFTLRPEEIAQIDLYIWLEGMDYDCTNEIGDGAQLQANIQFSADPGGQGGMTDINGKD